jgi:hypothetical protein
VTEATREGRQREVGPASGSDLHGFARIDPEKRRSRKARGLFVGSLGLAPFRPTFWINTRELHLLF